MPLLFTSTAQPSTSATEGANTSASRVEDSKWKRRFVLFVQTRFAFVFVLALAVALVQNFLVPNGRTTFIFDSSHYLITAQKMTELLIVALSGKSTASLLYEPNFVSFLSLDGPVVPGFWAALFALIRHVPTTVDWPFVVAVQSVLHAFSSVAIALLCRMLSGRREYAFLAGCLWAFYPGALLASGRFLTEPLSIVLLSFCLLSLSKYPSGYLNKMSSGILCGLLVLLKPAFAPAVGLALAYTWLRDGRKLMQLAVMSCAFLAILAPWAVYSKMTTGKFSFTVQRGPTFNVAKGMDVEADGWGLIPDSPLRALFTEDDGPMATLSAIVSTHPQESAQLCLRKITRLYAQPWNDFKHQVLVPGLSWQIGYHWFLLATGLAGLMAFLFEGRNFVHERGKRTAIVLAIFLVTQSVYLIFEAITRYGFLTMPLLTVFAGYGLSLLLDGKVSFGRKVRLGVMIALASSLVCGIVMAEDVTRLREAKEIAHQVTPGQTFAKTFTFIQGSVPATLETALVLIDADDNCRSMKVVCNGRLVSDSPIPLGYFDSSKYQQYEMLRKYVQAMGLNLNDLRQWYAVELPVAWLNLSGANTVEFVAADKPVTIYGDKACVPDSPADKNNSNQVATSVKMLSTDCVNSGKLCNSLLSKEIREFSVVPTAKVIESSFTLQQGQEVQSNCLPAVTSLPHLAFSSTSGSEQNKVMLGDSLRIRLLLVPAPVLLATAAPAGAAATANNASSDKSLTSLKYTRSISPEDFDFYMRDNDSQFIRVNKTTGKIARRNYAMVNVDALEPSSHVKVRLTFKALPEKVAGKLGVTIAVVGKNTTVVIPANVPHYVAVPAQGGTFTIEDLVPVKLLNGKLEALLVSFYPGPWLETSQYGPPRDAINAKVGEITLEASPVNMPELSGKQTIYY